MPSRWSVVDRDAAPDMPAVYAIYSKGSCVYIGSTACLKKRLVQHEVLRSLDAYCVKWRHVPIDKLRLTERLLIYRVKPSINQLHKFNNPSVKLGHVGIWMPRALFHKLRRTSMQQHQSLARTVALMIEKCLTERRASAAR